METNLLDIINKQISGDLIQKAAGFIEEENGLTQKALNIVLPSLLGGIAQQATEPNKAAQLMSRITEGGHDGSIFGTIGNLLSGGSATQGLMDSGETIVHNLFGDKTSSILDWIASFANIKTGAAANLMNMAAPLVMGAIGKQVVDNDMGINGLTALMDDQSGFIKKALPAGLSSVLGFTHLKKETPSVFGEKNIQLPAESTDEVLNEKILLTRIFPWLILLVAGIAGMMFLRTCKTGVPEAPVATVLPDVKPAMPVALVDTITVIKLPEGDIKVKTGSFLDELNKEVSDSTLDQTKAITFDNINFATNSATLTDSSMTQLNDMVKILKAYPKVALKIEGHTDSKGNAQSNKKLSQNRAASVKNYLQKMGINADRMTTAGLGSDKAKADNATESGRAVNRRIEAFVVKK